MLAEQLSRTQNKRALTRCAVCDTTPRGSGEPGGSGRGGCVRGAINNRAPHRSPLGEERASGLTRFLRVRILCLTRVNPRLTRGHGSAPPLPRPHLACAIFTSHRLFFLVVIFVFVYSNCTPFPNPTTPTRLWFTTGTGALGLTHQKQFTSVWVFVYECSVVCICVSVCMWETTDQECLLSSLPSNCHV